MKHLYLSSILFLCCMAGPLAAQRFVDGAGGCGGNSPCYTTIQAAVAAASAGETVTVYPGTYTENVTLSKSLTVVSTGGRGSTIIQGFQTSPAPSVYGAVTIEGVTSGVSIGTSSADGFTIIGVDWPTNVTDVGAVYVRGGPHTGLSIVGNDIRANGDNGFVLQSNTPVSGFLFDRNILSGKTYLGSQPEQTCCSSSCYFDNTSSNVARSLFTLNPGASNVTFSNNLITGSAGAGSNGNVLVQFEAATARIQYNTFSGTTVSPGGTCLRGNLIVRGSAVSVHCNPFHAAGLSGSNRFHVRMDQNTGPLTGADPMVDTFTEISQQNNYDRNPVAFSNALRTIFISMTDASSQDGAARTARGSCTVPLPVQWFGFQGTVIENRAVELVWKTAWEQGNLRFEIERSRDAVTYEPIGQVPGAGTTQRTSTYRFLDNEPPAGIAYYRLKQVDADGQSSYSRPISVNFKGADLLTVYPNPAFDQIRVRSASGSGIESLGLYDAVGRPVRQSRGSMVLSLTGLPQGMYRLEIRLTGGEVYWRKVVKSR
ncbi:T9SS type A sorting domain-containing protein [Larkinella soli]|uniref:T9SS type A sorting domain-containing protein n=1 Tax=Larkinella soli TaxID=1770527 RepID=UPI000FFC2444|nr:T9SS type A sorting domain-containing protein [Larkinella soli]